jgi:hypothetical protein
MEYKPTGAKIATADLEVNEEGITMICGTNMSLTNRQCVN